MNDILDTTNSDVQENDVLTLNQFILQYGDGLLNTIKNNIPPLYDGNNINDSLRNGWLNSLKRKPFDAQRRTVLAASSLLIDEDEKACILNCDMGTGKTMMALCLSRILYEHGHKRTLILSPPHLVYKWRREILDTIPNAKVWVLNGPDTLVKLLRFRDEVRYVNSQPEYFILGRVRMRLGFNWVPAFMTRYKYSMEQADAFDENSPKIRTKTEMACCSDCGNPIYVNDISEEPLTPHQAIRLQKRLKCTSCGSPLWTLHRKKLLKSKDKLVIDGLIKLPTIGIKTANKLVSIFGEDTLMDMLTDNIYSFVNMLDESGNLIFSDSKALRLEKSLGKMEFNFSTGDYQATEFIKRYLPKNAFDLLVVDEGHEYKSSGSAQGSAMAVLCEKVDKIILLTGTLIAGYADDLFYLLWRIMKSKMIEDGYVYNNKGTLNSAALTWMKNHGVLKEVRRSSDSSSYKTSNAKDVRVNVKKSPGFGPNGIVRYVLPYTVFMRLSDIDQGVLPDYDEFFEPVSMSHKMESIYKSMEQQLLFELKNSLRNGDKSLLGVVQNALLSFPESCFNSRSIIHPNSKKTLFFSKSLFSNDELTPKEEKLVDIISDELKMGRRVLVYSIYTGKHDTTKRLSNILKGFNYKFPVLKSTVSTEKREDWILEQFDKGCDGIICNPELVKTGLDLLEFPTIVYMQTGYNVYTLMQSRLRSYRIGQKRDVKVIYLGYEGTLQMKCLELMAKKIAVTQSTSGAMPESGLDSLSEESDSIEVELAKHLLN